MSRRALITGARGQDGWYLSELLLSQGYTVHAQSREQVVETEAHRSGIVWHAGDLTKVEFSEHLITTIEPDEIYNLAAITRPMVSWTIPEETLRLNALVPQTICGILIKRRPQCRFFQASSSAIFGNLNGGRQSESTPCNPTNPYGISKLYAHQIVAAYRSQYGLLGACGILFNHESPRRPLGFVSQKIAHAAAAISLGIRDTIELDELGRNIVLDGKVRLGDISIRRDFTYAKDVVRAMQMIVTDETPDDYVIGSDEDHSIAEFCEAAFKYVGHNWRDFVTTDTALVRKSDGYNHADSSKLRRKLGWQPQTSFNDLVAMMVDGRISALRNSPQRWIA